MAFLGVIKQDAQPLDSGYIMWGPPPSTQLQRFIETDLRLHYLTSVSLSTMSKTRRKLHLCTVSVDLGCSSCRKPKLSFIFFAKPKLKTPTGTKTSCLPRNSSSSFDRNDTASSASPLFSGNLDSHSSSFSESETDTKSSLTLKGLGRNGGDSVAVEKESDDPYLDFRQSMLQMILENEIYSKDDLCELLNCFLQLNCRSHHGIIVRAFAEIWNGVYSVRSAGSFPPVKKVHSEYNPNNI